MMHEDNSSSSVDANALKAFGLATIGLFLGVFAFKLHLRGGDDKFFTYSLGLACSGFYTSSIIKLTKALRSRSPAQAGAPGIAQLAFTALTVTLAGIPIFILSSVLANYMTTFHELSGVEIFAGLMAALLPLFGPFILGAIYFYWMQQSLCDAGWNIVFALIVATLCASGSTYAWYAVNLHYGPRIYQLLIS